MKTESRAHKTINALLLIKAPDIDKIVKQNTRLIIRF